MISPFELPVPRRRKHKVKHKKKHKDEKDRKHKEGEVISFDRLDFDDVDVGCFGR